MESIIANVFLYLAMGALGLMCLMLFAAMHEHHKANVRLEKQNKEWRRQLGMDEEEL